jgi:hypothetical protein
MTLTRPRTINRRQLLDRVGIAAISALAISLGGSALAVSPPAGPAPLPSNREPDRRARVAQQWEDVLLLEAIRYLDLSPSQVEAVRPLAKAADERLAKLREQEEKKLVELEPLVQRQREALLSGKTTKDQADTALRWQSLQQRRAQVEEEIIQYVAPRLARLLSRAQVRRAFLLARGGGLPGEVISAALLDPSSGFVVNEVTKNHWREIFMKQALARLYPPHLLNIKDEDNQALIEEIARRHTLDHGRLVGSPLTEEEEAILNLPRKRMDLEDAWRQRWADPSPSVAETEREQYWALYHFVRRMFLSARLTPVLTERAGQ